MNGLTDFIDRWTFGVYRQIRDLRMEGRADLEIVVPEHFASALTDATWFGLPLVAGRVEAPMVRQAQHIDVIVDPFPDL